MHHVPIRSIALDATHLLSASIESAVGHMLPSASQQNCPFRFGQPTRAVRPHSARFGIMRMRVVSLKRVWWRIAKRAWAPSKT